MKASGYMPNIIPMFLDGKVDNNELLLYQHCENLAVVFGLLKTPPRPVIKDGKNIRVCNDYHNATKFISKIFARDIGMT